MQGGNRASLFFPLAMNGVRGVERLRRMAPRGHPTKARQKPCGNCSCRFASSLRNYYAQLLQERAVWRCFARILREGRTWHADGWVVDEPWLTTLFHKSRMSVNCSVSSAGDDPVGTADGAMASHSRPVAGRSEKAPPSREFRIPNFDPSPWWNRGVLTPQQFRRHLPTRYLSAWLQVPPQFVAAG